LIGSNDVVVVVVVVVFVFVFVVIASGGGRGGKAFPPALAFVHMNPLVSR